jgi:hypothetical protein
MECFYLGVHEPAWLARLEIPLLVSHRRLAPRRRLPHAILPWALDSGGFTELAMYGRWQTTPAAYAHAVARYAAEIGNLAWAAPQDWMCEPAILARTGRTVAEHQARTVANYLALRALAPTLPFIPVVQGWTISHYLDCVDRYANAGIDLARLPLVGLGSVCRRQHTPTVAAIVRTLAEGGLRLHGFGISTRGLARYADALESADSMAWSASARHGRIRLPGCTHRACSNCPRYALAWQQRLTARLAQPPPRRPSPLDVAAAAPAPSWRAA